MHTQSHKLWLGRLFALIPLALSASACFTATVGDGKCFEEDGGYADGGCSDEDEDGDYSDAGYADAGWGGYSDAGSSDGGGQCSYRGKPVAVGQYITTGYECEACYCGVGGKLYCQEYSCPADGGAPACFVNGDSYAPGKFTPDGYDCTCSCSTDGKLDCEPGCEFDAGADYADAGWDPYSDGGWVSADGGWWPSVDGGYSDSGIWPGPGWDDASAPSLDGGWPVDAGTCVYEGKPYATGEYIPTEKTCAKCHCGADGVITCDSTPCMTPSGCYLGDTLYPVGQTLVCADGCNTCTCGSKLDPTVTSWSSSTIACPALPVIMACPEGVSSSAFPAQLVYREKDAVAVVDSRCVNGQTLDYGLCWEGDLTKAVAQLYVFSAGTQRACNAAASERVFSLLPLRQALVTAFPNQPDVKASLRGSDKTLTYSFHAP